jgi:hypothetical protein
MVTMVTISIEDSQVKVNNATVINTDILAINGVTHGIETVLMPAARTIAPTMTPTMTPTMAPTTANSLAPIMAQTNAKTLAPTMAPANAPTSPPAPDTRSAGAALGTSFLGLFVMVLAVAM